MDKVDVPQKNYSCKSGKFNDNGPVVNVQHVFHNQEQKAKWQVPETKISQKKKKKG